GQMEGFLEMLNSLESCASKQRKFFNDLVWSANVPRPLLESQLDPTKHYVRIHTECYYDPRDGIAPTMATAYLDPGLPEVDRWRNATLHCRNPSRDTSGLPVRHKFSMMHGEDRRCTTWARWVSYNSKTKRWEKSEH